MKKDWTDDYLNNFNNMSKETLLKEFRERFPQIMKDLLDEEIKKYPNITNEYWLAIEEFILKAIDQTRKETIRDNNLVDLTGKNGDTIYHNDGLTGKRYTWKCINIEKLTN